MTKHWARPFVLMSLALILLVGAGLQGCASSGDTSSNEDGTETASESKPAAGKMAPVPASSPLAKIEAGMTEIQVRNLLGEPGATNYYPTGRAFNPFYFGRDAFRTDWIYEDVGRVIFARGKFGGRTVVVDRLHNPDEKG